MRDSSVIITMEQCALLLVICWHFYELVDGDPQVRTIESRLLAQPDITVPCISIDGDVDGVDSGTAHHAGKFSGPHEHRVFGDTGHNLPQEQPQLWSKAVLDAKAMADKMT